METIGLDKEELLDLYNTDLETLLELSSQYMSKNIEFCSLVNARSGKCSQNCKYCAQSSHYRTDIETYPLIDKEEVLKAAKEAKEYGVRIYCLLPGPVATDFYRKSGVKAPMHAMKSDKVVAYTIKHMKKKCFIIPGVMNRIVRFLPESICIYFIKKTKWKKIQKKRG